MTPLFILLIVFLAAVETLASYISRVYSEFGKILSREEQENLDAWEEQVEPQLGLSREHAELCAAVSAAACPGPHRPRFRRGAL
jgi:putative hemolysin